MTSMHAWRFRDGSLDLRTPRILGIVNATPDSFSDGGQFDSADAAIAHALSLVAQGADIVDIGGESTRPGAEMVAADEEIERVVPVIRGVRSQCDVPISVDTTKVEVAREAIAAGANIVNDISGMTFEPAMAKLVAETNAGVSLMHTPGRPNVMQQLAHYEDVVAEVYAYLEQRIAQAVAGGIARASIVVDPGFGFGKNGAQNYALLRALDRLHGLGCPLLIGVSRKRMIREVAGDSNARIAHGTTAAHVLALLGGAAVLRVHDVEAADAARRIVVRYGGETTTR